MALVPAGRSAQNVINLVRIPSAIARLRENDDMATPLLYSEQTPTEVLNAIVASGSIRWEDLDPSDRWDARHRQAPPHRRL